MIINYNNAEFIKSCFDVKSAKTKNLPEIVFVGRSNVGKSSMINALLYRKNFARVSSVPGKTAAINFYEIDRKVNFVDLPGYGFAKRSAAERRVWGRLIGDYLSSGRDIRMVVFLVDSRHDPSENDMLMYRYLMNTQFLFIVAATKTDKLSSAVASARIKKLSGIFGIDVIGFSSQTKNGISEIRNIIEDVIGVAHNPVEIKAVDYTVLEELE